MTFSECSFVSGEDKLTPICFQMFFLDSLKLSHQILLGIKKYKLSFPCELWRNIFRKYIGLHNCSINVYLFLNIVPGLAQTAHEKLVEFGRWVWCMKNLVESFNWVKSCFSFALETNCTFQQPFWSSAMRVANNFFRRRLFGSPECEYRTLSCRSSTTLLTWFCK